MSNELKVTVVEDANSCIGAWEIICEECPLLPHLQALNQKPRPCIKGFSTNMQGAIPTGQCEHYQKDSIEGGESLTLKCSHGD